MDEFEKLKYDGDYKTYGYYKTHKLKNNQTIGIYFWGHESSKSNDYVILLAIANKKKHLRQLILGEKDILIDHETGKCGLEGLLWGKKQILKFEESKYCENGDNISIYWTDNRRRDGKKCLSKKIIK